MTRTGEIRIWSLTRVLIWSAIAKPFPENEMNPPAATALSGQK